MFGGCVRRGEGAHHHPIERCFCPPVAPSRIATPLKSATGWSLCPAVPGRRIKVSLISTTLELHCSFPAMHPWTDWFKSSPGWNGALALSYPNNPCSEGGDSVNLFLASLGTSMVVLFCSQLLPYTHLCGQPLSFSFVSHSNVCSILLVFLRFHIFSSFHLCLPFRLCFSVLSSNKQWKRNSMCTEAKIQDVSQRE